MKSLVKLTLGCRDAIIDKSVYPIISENDKIYVVQDNKGHVYQLDISYVDSTSRYIDKRTHTEFIYVVVEDNAAQLPTKLEELKMKVSQLDMKKQEALRTLIELRNNIDSIKQDIEEYDTLILRYMKELLCSGGMNNEL